VTQSAHRRNRAPVSDDSEDDGEEQGDDMEVDGDESQAQVVKKLVRYALACEFQRLPIKRAGISEKGWHLHCAEESKLTGTVMQKQRAPFKRVFEQAQMQLRTKFGMEMVELPVREKITMRDKRCRLFWGEYRRMLISH
jgi:hypothetical protein